MKGSRHFIFLDRLSPRCKYPVGTAFRCLQSIKRTGRRSLFIGKAPKQIIKVGQIKFKCTYKEESLDLIIANLGKNSKLTITFDSGSTWVVWGWLEEFNPDTDTEDTPMAEAVLELSMRQDNADPVVTVAPVYTAFDPDA